MTFRPRNAYYLRVSTNTVLPLLLYLDERHIDWMSDAVLQHVLVDLRPLIIPKLQAEKDVHFGPGASPGNKRGTVEVHRGGTYQFAYFFRKTGLHTVLFKSRYFVTALPRPEVVPELGAAQLADRNPRKKTIKTQVPGKQSKRKRAKSRAKNKPSQSRFDKGEWTARESEEDMDDADPIPREPRPVQKQRRVAADISEEDEEGVKDTRHITMDSPPPEMDGGFAENPGVPTINDEDEPPDTADIELLVEEEENKPKPLLKLKYQSFSISGHCLCIVVEPWPPLRTGAKLPAGLGTPLQCGGPEPSLFPPNESVVGQRAKTPLFLPEYDRAPSVAPFAREGTLLPARTGDDNYSDDGLISFSQTLNAVGHMHTITADDDDMDGAVLFGDADEVRGLF